MSITMRKASKQCRPREKYCVALETDTCGPNHRGEPKIRKYWYQVREIKLIIYNLRRVMKKNHSFVIGIKECYKTEKYYIDEINAEYGPIVKTINYF